MKTERTVKTGKCLDVCILIGLAALVLLAFLVRHLLRADGSGEVVIRYGTEQVLRVPLEKDRTIIIRNGEIVTEQTGKGQENVIVIENGEAFMQSATCPGCDCVRQGAVSEQNADLRPLGRWIICAPHRVSVEVTGEGTA